MIIYISGPMSAHQKTDWNFPQFNEAARKLRAAGYGVLNPADHGADPEWTWEMYLRLDLQDLLGADGVATIEGWESSRGASLEVTVARALGLKVAPLADWLA